MAKQDNTILIGIAALAALLLFARKKPEPIVPILPPGQYVGFWEGNRAWIMRNGFRYNFTTRTSQPTQVDAIITIDANRNISITVD